MFLKDPRWCWRGKLILSDRAGFCTHSFKTNQVFPKCPVTSCRRPLSWTSYLGVQVVSGPVCQTTRGSAVFWLSMCPLKPNCLLSVFPLIRRWACSLTSLSVYLQWGREGWWQCHPHRVILIGQWANICGVLTPCLEHSTHLYEDQIFFIKIHVKSHRS